MSDDATIGQEIDAKIEAVRTEVNEKIDQLSARVDELQAAIDTRQGQSQSQTADQSAEALSQSQVPIEGEQPTAPPI